MNASAIIAEDEPLLARNLAEMLAIAWPQLQILDSASTGRGAIELAQQLRPDVIFLDIRMPAGDGLEVARSVIDEWPAEQSLPLIVFTTAYDDHTLEAFQVSAADYLLKPIQAEALRSTCQRLQRRLAERGASGDDAALASLQSLLSSGRAPGPSLEPAAQQEGGPLRFLQASCGTSLHLIATEEIVYFEAQDRYVRAVTANRDYLLRTPLRELVTRLDAHLFWQIHRSTVVRADHIHLVHREPDGKMYAVLKQRPERLLISRSYQHLFRAM